MTAAPATSGVWYEPYDNECRKRQFEIYKDLRENAPVYKAESGWWCVSRYEDTKTILTNPDKFSSKIIQEQAFGLPTDVDPSKEPEKLELLKAIVSDIPVPIEELLAARSLVSTDEPEHSRLRKIVNRGFLPHKVKALGPTIKEIVAKCLEGIEDAKTFEVMEKLAIPVPVRVIGDFLSVDHKDLDKIKRWSDVSMEASSGAIRQTPESQAMLLQNLKEFASYFVPIIEDRRRNLGEDLISEMVRAEDADSLTVPETLMFILSVMVAGNETTTALIGNTVVNLMKNPKQLTKLISNPDLMPGAVQESLRYTAPIQFYWREALCDVELSGVTIPAGEKVLVMPGSANRDPDAFPNPDDYDITRDFKTPFLSFGYGIHHCLGAHLAPFEAQLALRGLLPHLHRFELSDEPLEFPPSFIAYAYKRVLLQERADLAKTA